MKSVFPAILLYLAAGIIPLEHWNVDGTNAKILFSVDGPFGTVNGSFSGLKATIEFNEKDPTGSSVSASIDAKTVSTGIFLRNSDLRNKEMWLDIDKYPVISFKSTKIEKLNTGYKISGNLTLKATTKPIEFPFTFTPGGNGAVFKGHFTINREDYKIGNKGGSVGDIITISLEVPVKK